MGANKPRHDSVDTRALSDVTRRSFTAKGGKGGLFGIIDSQKDVGGYPVMKGGGAPADTDHDGLPDAWETAHGLDPANPADAAQPSAKARGYTQLEVYLNSL